MEGDRLHLDVDEAIALCGENTIGVIGIPGATYDGSYEPIDTLAAALDVHEKHTGLDMPIHVDAASGGFIAPFLQSELKSDFMVNRVVECGPVDGRDQGVLG